MRISVVKVYHQISFRILSCGKMSEIYRGPEVPEAKPSDRMSRWPCKDYFGGTWNSSFCGKRHPLECFLQNTRVVVRCGRSAHSHTVMLMNSDEEMQEWMEGRHRDFHSAMASGRLFEVSKISSLVTEAARDCQTRQLDVSDDEIALRTAPGEGRYAPYWVLYGWWHTSVLPRMPCGKSNQPRSRQQAAPVAEIEGVTVTGRWHRSPGHRHRSWGTFLKQTWVFVECGRSFFSCTQPTERSDPCVGERFVRPPTRRGGAQEGCVGPWRFTKDTSFRFTKNTSFSAKQGATQFDATQFSKVHHPCQFGSGLEVGVDPFSADGPPINSRNIQRSCSIFRAQIRSVRKTKRGHRRFGGRHRAGKVSFWRDVCRKVLEIWRLTLPALMGCQKVVRKQGMGPQRQKCPSGCGHEDVRRCSQVWTVFSWKMCYPDDNVWWEPFHSFWKEHSGLLWEQPSMKWSQGMSRAMNPAWKRGGSCSCVPPPMGGMVPKKKLEERVSRFEDGSWLRLLEESQTSEAQADQVSARKRRNQGDSVEKRIFWRNRAVLRES